MPLNKTVLLKGAKEPGGPQIKHRAPLPFASQFERPELLQNEVISRGLKGQFLFCRRLFKPNTVSVQREDEAAC